MPNPQAVGTLRDLDDAACDQDDRQLAHIRRGRRLFEAIEEKRHDPEAIRILALAGQDNQTASEREEELDKTINTQRREATKAIARMPQKEAKPA